MMRISCSTRTSDLRTTNSELRTTNDEQRVTMRSTGVLLLIGGAEDKIGGRTILSRFIELAGGDAARIAVVATASAFQEYVGQRYVSLFQEMGVANAAPLQLGTRQEAENPATLALLAQATGIFMTGGDQLKLTAVLGGTTTERRIRERFANGVVVAGTSAGASVASEHMLAYGLSGVPPRKALMQFAPGLGLLRGAVVDQHFGARGRVGRLLTAVAHNPGLLGIGLDEDTAIEIHDNQVFSVLGSGTVMIVDGSEVSHTNIYAVNERAPVAICDLRVHTLTSGYGYNIESRRPIMPDPTAPDIPPDMV